MSDPVLQPTSTPLILGNAYAISKLFTFVPGTGPDGEAVVGVRVGFYPTPNELFSPSTPDVAGLDDYRVEGDLSGVGANGDPSWDSATLTFTGLPNTTALSLSGYLQFIIAPSTQFPDGWVFADPVTYTFHFGSAPLLSVTPSSASANVPIAWKSAPPGLGFRMSKSLSRKPA
jgi:hypothetical protein